MSIWGSDRLRGDPQCPPWPRAAASLQEHIDVAACRARERGSPYAFTLNQARVLVNPDGTYRYLRGGPAQAQPATAAGAPGFQELQAADRALAAARTAAPPPPPPPAPAGGAPRVSTTQLLPRERLTLAGFGPSDAEIAAIESVRCPSGWVRQAVRDPRTGKTIQTCVPAPGRGSVEQAREYAAATEQARQVARETFAAPDPYATIGADMSIWGTLADIGGEILQGFTGIDLSPVGIGFPDTGTGQQGGISAPGVPQTLPGGAPTAPSFPTYGAPTYGAPLVATAGPECPQGTVNIMGKCYGGMLPGGAPPTIGAPPGTYYPPTAAPAPAPSPNGIGCPSGYHPNKTSYYTREGWVQKGTRCVRNRRRNALNPRAARRAMSRLKAAKQATEMLKGLRLPEKC